MTPFQYMQCHCELGIVNGKWPKLCPRAANKEDEHKVTYILVIFEQKMFEYSPIVFKPKNI